MHQHHHRNLQTAIHLMSPTSIKLPEIHLPTFDGTIENWHAFYDSFSSTIDQNERLTPVQKFHYLRSSLTGRAARSIQSLDITEINYSIAIDVLKEKFDCHRQICMRHWDLICDYPQITTETLEALEDFLETIKVNLRVLEKLGEPVTSNVILVKILTSKLPSSTIREWQRTLPNKRMPSHTHLINFLTTRANGDQNNFTSKETKGACDQRPRQRLQAPQGHAFITSQAPSTCPTCQGSHSIWRCDSFKSKSLRERLREVKRASLCMNCLRKGHTVRDCHAGSCRACGERHHHMMLHRAKRYSGSRSSTPSPKSFPSNSRSTTPSLSPPSSPTRHRRHTTNHRLETPRTASPPSPSSTEHTRPTASKSLSNDIIITAHINILNDKHQPIRCRALLDTGCSMNFITEKLAKSLEIKQNKCSVPIGALDTLTTTSRRYITPRSLLRTTRTNEH